MAANYVFERKNMAKDLNVAGLKFVDMPSMSFKVEVGYGGKISKDADNKLVHKLFDEAAEEAYKIICDNLGDRIRKFDKLFEFMDSNPKGADQKIIESNIAGLKKTVTEQREVGQAIAEKYIEKAWEKFVKDRSDYRKYKIKIAVTITGAVAGLAVSIGLMASAPFTGGASAALSIIGMFKSAATIFKEVGSAWMEVETAQKKLSKELDLLDKYFKDAKKRVAAEVTATFLNNIIGVANPSLKTCKGELDTIKNKVIGVKMKAYNAAETLKKFEKEEKKLRTEFLVEADKQLKKLAPQKSKQQLPKIAQDLDKAVKEVQELAAKQLTVIDDLFDRFKAAEAVTGQLDARIGQLEKVLSAKEKNAMAIIDNVLLFSSLPLAALNGNGVVKSTSDIATNLGTAIGSLAYDRIASKTLGGTIFEGATL